MKGEDRPFTWAWKLHDVMRWLQPEPSEGEAHVLAKVEQFVERLPGSTAIGQRAWRLRSPWLSTWQPWQKEQSGAASQSAGRVERTGFTATQRTAAKPVLSHSHIHP